MSAVEELMEKLLRNPRLLLLCGSGQLMRAFVETANRSYDCDIVTVSNPEDAEDTADSNLEVAFVDVSLPGAFRFAEWATRKHPALPVVLIATPETRLLALTFLRIGVFYVVLAPVREEDFERIFAQCKVHARTRVDNVYFEHAVAHPARTAAY